MSIINDLETNFQEITKSINNKKLIGHLTIYLDEKARPEVHIENIKEFNYTIGDQSFTITGKLEDGEFNYLFMYKVFSHLESTFTNELREDF